MDVKNILRKVLGVPQTAEVFDLRENVAAKVSRPIALKQPPPGHAVVEILNADGRVIAVDTFEVPAAPAGALCVGPKAEIPFTFVRIGLTSLRHQEGEVPLPLPDKSGLNFKLPSHLRNKPDAVKARIYWSCEVRK